MVDKRRTKASLWKNKSFLNKSSASDFSPFAMSMLPIRKRKNRLKQMKDIFSAKHLNAWKRHDLL